ncbi:hypothetical protein, partial [Neisseria gonorrhoeae]|uniref:hypothetical protein n=3 Tax=Neisseria gonorrhoeae TaxID=485 RepID=UPI00352BAF9C
PQAASNAAAAIAKSGLIFENVTIFSIPLYIAPRQKKRGGGLLFLTPPLTAKLKGAFYIIIKINIFFFSFTEIVFEGIPSKAGIISQHRRYPNIPPFSLSFRQNTFFLYSLTC